MSMANDYAERVIDNSGSRVMTGCWLIAPVSDENVEVQRRVSRTICGQILPLSNFKNEHFLLFCIAGLCTFTELRVDSN